MSDLSVPFRENEIESSGRQYRLSLRGNSLNPMIDAATPLLGMVMRLQSMNSKAMPEHLFSQVVTDIQALEQSLQEQGYEPGIIISFRYILCTFIDETALGQGWSNKNEWIRQSLLVHFHNETWGGEKVFILLERLIREPKRYQDLLEFLYLCFSLGFRGRYKVAASNQDEFEQIYPYLAPGGIVREYSGTRYLRRFFIRSAEITHNLFSISISHHIVPAASPGLTNVNSCHFMSIRFISVRLIGSKRYISSGRYSGRIVAICSSASKIRYRWWRLDWHPAGRN